MTHILANRSGHLGEGAIEDLLRRHGCDYSRQVTLAESVYTPQRIRADFVVHNLIEFPTGLVIEVKRQDGDGSVDEKFPYVVLNIRGHAYRDHPVVVVLYGSGFRPAAVAWLKRQIDGREFVAVFTSEELDSWLLRHVHVHVTSPKLPWTTRSNPA